MKNRILALILLCCAIFALTGCRRTVTINSAYGVKTGTYTGDTNEKGEPHGQGKFSSYNAHNEKWTYEGEFKDGHFNGEGKTTWKSGAVEIGTYKDDVIVPMKGDEISSLFSAPDSFINHFIELNGHVISKPQSSDDGFYIQVSADIGNTKNNVVVYIWDNTFNPKQDDYVRIVGKVTDISNSSVDFENSESAVMLLATDFEVLNRKEK